MKKTSKIDRGICVYPGCWAKATMDCDKCTAHTYAVLPPVGRRRHERKASERAFSRRCWVAPGMKYCFNESHKGKECSR